MKPFAWFITLGLPIDMPPTQIVWVALYQEVRIVFNSLHPGPYSPIQRRDLIISCVSYVTHEG